ncbi:HD-GYP domain-containing protein [Sphaerotilus mobilis]|uniref:Metal dependent phosphohydrolase n=1 Tax=Sphaerotilus mobilis TaxID=47994 RepID=A0A4Q7LJZ7_9BURK|nr:HD domain-containing phosphohydrolase [Sphaerotilus mobilis]RZS54421.1 metal dependent phosphohydrolase [Sphaerotilus mobilis]
MTQPDALHLLEVGARSHDSLSERLASLHAQVRRIVPAVDRIACALYETDGDELVTFVHSTLSAEPLRAYRFRLSDSQALSDLVARRGERVVDDIQVEFADVLADPGRSHAHTRWLVDQGYRSSYTLPLFDHERLIGMLFFDAMTPGAFSPLVCERLRPHANLVALLLSQELTTMRMLVGSIKLAQAFANLRDIETGSHLSRISSYVRLMARRLAAERGWDDEFIEHVFLFSPLHDIGKVGVADEILLKPGRLEPHEWREMTTHVAKGEQIVEEMVTTFDLEHLPGVQVLRQIVAAHHECLDGSGYPRGLKGHEVPDAARLVAVADVYDALRSERPYKPAWPVETTLAELRRLASRGRLDAGIVEALVCDVDAFEALRLRFHDPEPTAPG